VSFTGEFRHTIDPKGRLIVPSRIRYELEEDKVVLTRWTNGSIAMWSGEGWRRLEQSLLEQRKADDTAQTFLRALAATAHTDSVDSQGRVTVPDALRTHAGIERECVVTGAIDHAEIWSPEGWDAEQTKSESNFDELLRNLSF
jgi:MraZ protein